MSESNQYCTSWVVGDYPLTPCRCPECSGFLPTDFPQDKPFKCKKCGVTIYPMAGRVEDEDLGYSVDGKLCVKPKHLRSLDEIKEQEDYKEKRRLLLKERRENRKTKTNLIAFIGETTQRIVWKDKDGFFIEVCNTTFRGKMRLTDERITRIIDRTTFKEVNLEEIDKI